MGRALMQAADQIKQAGPDHDPRPVRDGEMVLHVLDLVMQQERRDAQGQAENGDAAERDRHAHHALPPHSLEHEQAEDAIDEIKQADQVVRWREIAAARLEDRRGLGKLGDDEGGKPDQAAPHYPAHALIILGTLTPRPLEQDGDGEEGHDEAGEDGKARAGLGAISGQAAIGGGEAERQRDADEWKRTFEPPPFRVGPTVRRAQDEKQKTDIASGFRDGARSVLRQEQRRPSLQDGVEGIELPRVEPHHVKKETPAHRSRPGPDEPGRGDHDQDAGDLIERHDEALEWIGSW